MAANPRPYHNAASAGGNLTGDTTSTKIFVGGLAWETQRDTMRRYFEPFGEILEAVVITDKTTGRSKGYGFVTFKDPDSAIRACQDPSPVIDGRRANCNLASLGSSHRSRPPPPQYAAGRFRPQPPTSSLISSSYRGPLSASLSTAYYHPPAHYAQPYSVYGYSAAGYSQEHMYPVVSFSPMDQTYSSQSYQQLSAYYPTAAAATHGVFPNYYPYYAQYTQSAQAHSGFGLQMLQYPYLPQQFGSGSAPILSLPAASVALPAAGVNSMASSSAQPPPRSAHHNQ